MKNEIKIKTNLTKWSITRSHVDVHGKWVRKFFYSIQLYAIVPSENLNYPFTDLILVIFKMTSIRRKRGANCRSNKANEIVNLWCNLKCNLKILIQLRVKTSHLTRQFHFKCIQVHFSSCWPIEHPHLQAQIDIRDESVLLCTTSPSKKVT